MRSAFLAVFSALVSMSVPATPAAPAPTTAVPAASGVSAPSVDVRAVAQRLAGSLASDFVYPAQGKKYAAALLANSAAGKYDGLEGFDLTSALTADLQQVAPDGHLRVQMQAAGGAGGPQIIVRREPPKGGAADVGSAVPQKPTIIHMAPPPQMESQRWLAPGVAFVRLNFFPGTPESIEAARRFMAEYAGAKVIIFDVRNHMGGGLEEMDTVFPWLFAKPTLLVRMATRKSVEEAGRSPFEDSPTLRRVVADPNFVTREHWAIPGKDKRAFAAKVYVLTSRKTGSAGEHFALALKASKRATLIGSATHGANHFGVDLDLGGGMTAFIPVGRTYDPATGKDWEVVGVAPDIVIDPAQALVKALQLSGVASSEAVKLAADVASGMPM